MAEVGRAVIKVEVDMPEMVAAIHAFEDAFRQSCESLADLRLKLENLKPPAVFEEHDA